MPEEMKHKLPPSEEGKGKQLGYKFDPNNPHEAHMAELFKEVGDSKPQTIQEFFMRLDAISKINVDPNAKQ